MKYLGTYEENQDVATKEKVEAKLFYDAASDTVIQDGADVTEKVANSLEMYIAPGDIGAVSYTNQELDDNQKQQARANIGIKNLVDATATGSVRMASVPDANVTGNCAFAEGSNTTASSFASHAEGVGSTASGAMGSHAEGNYTTASGYTSHAEGILSTASSYATHAEGTQTTASGNISHAEGNSTIANHAAQHVQGEFNVEDDSTAAASARGNYAHIVGNGTSSARSNAHTLDWDGNAWFAGDVYVGSTSGTNKDDGSVKLMKEPATATDGQVLTYNGTEWEAADASGGDISGVINRTTNVNAADTNYTTLMARGEKLLDATTFDAVTDWSTQLVNGAIAWRYE